MLTEAAVIIVTVTVVLGTLAIAAVGLRLYCRHLQQVPLGGDDYCMVAALFLSTAVNILTDYTAATTGVGSSSYVPSMEATVFALKECLRLVFANFAAENAQIASIGIAKVSILLFYRRIFSVNKWFSQCNTILIGLVCSFTLAILVGVIFSKWPVYEQWNPEAPFNINISAILVSFLVLNALFDVLTLAIPIVALQSLQMDSQRKLVLSTIFTMGSVCIVASLFRLYYSVRYIKTPETPVSFFQVPFIYNSLWANIETPVFILAGCLLTFGPLYRKFPGFGSLLESFRSHLRRKPDRSSLPNVIKAEHDHVPENIERARLALHQPKERRHHLQKHVTAHGQWELYEVGPANSNKIAAKSAPAMV